jgi:hypothetical protein
MEETGLFFRGFFVEDGFDKAFVGVLFFVFAALVVMVVAWDEAGYCVWYQVPVCTSNLQ